MMNEKGKNTEKMAVIMDFYPPNWRSNIAHFPNSTGISQVSEKISGSFSPFGNGNDKMY